MIVHAWEEWGEACVERFRGMFAFALWDRNRETLFLARDRLGVKPLYYAHARRRPAAVRLGAQGAAAPSRVSAREIDPLAVEEYFALGYVPEPRTIYQRRRASCRRRTTLTLRRGEPAGAPRRYWDVRFAPTPPLPASRGLRRADRAACASRCALRLIADVPLGAFLSGGVDSSAVVATMAGADASRSTPARSPSTTRPSTSPRYARRGRRALPHPPSSSSASTATTST